MMKHILLLCVLVSLGHFYPKKIIIYRVGLEFSVGVFQVSSALSSAIKEAQAGIDCPMQVCSLLLLSG